MTKEQCSKHPLIRQIAELTDELMGMGAQLLIIYPGDSGWVQSHADTDTTKMSAFCTLVQSSPGGAKQCSMCHIMMTIAACSGGPCEQTCHAGATVLVCPASDPCTESMAVLSSCLFSSDKGWETVKKRGEKLELDLKSLHKYFQSLPKPDKGQLRILKMLMQAMSYALCEVHQNHMLSARLSNSKKSQNPVEKLTTFLENTTWAKNFQSSAANGRGKSLLVRVVCELIQQRPDLPLTVKEIAAAASLTPNHFTTLFHNHTGSSFNEYLTKQRIRRAQKLLLNPTLSVNEIAGLTGYDDPGYFTRRFRQQTGHSPREWRNHKASMEKHSQKPKKS